MGTPFENKITPPFIKVISEENKRNDEINKINEILEKADIEMLED